MWLSPRSLERRRLTPDFWFYFLLGKVEQERTVQELVAVFRNLGLYTYHAYLHRYLGRYVLTNGLPRRYVMYGSVLRSPYRDNQPRPEVGAGACGTREVVHGLLPDKLDARLTLAAWGR